MSRITEVERGGLARRAFYAVGKRMFGQVPTPERIIAHRMPLMLGIGAFYGSIEWFASVEAPLRALLQLQVARLRETAY